MRRLRGSSGARRLLNARAPESCFARTLENEGRAFGVMARDRAYTVGMPICSHSDCHVLADAERRVPPGIATVYALCNAHSGTIPVASFKHDDGRFGERVYVVWETTSDVLRRYGEDEYDSVEAAVIAYTTVTQY